MKQLSSFMVVELYGGDRISFTYQVVDDETGDLISTNERESFFVVDEELHGHIAAIQEYIRENKLTQ